MCITDFRQGCRSPSPFQSPTARADCVIVWEPNKCWSTSFPPSRSACTALSPLSHLKRFPRHHPCKNTTFFYPRHPPAGAHPSATLAPRVTSSLALQGLKVYSHHQATFKDASHVFPQAIFYLKTVPLPKISNLYAIKTPSLSVEELSPPSSATHVLPAILQARKPSSFSLPHSLRSCAHAPFLFAVWLSDWSRPLPSAFKVPLLQAPQHPLPALHPQPMPRLLRMLRPAPSAPAPSGATAAGTLLSA
ncbi:hypothetical protein DFH09DRAFT_1439475 [Mycena vulgaris]|nr:hypothetical protein DFH09DRAFT_1439475 [Mycena vulgaris]